MDEQHAWIKSRRKKRLRLLAVALCFCLLLTSYPDILETLSVLAAGTQDGDDTLYVTGFESLPEEVWEQTVPVGTGTGELELPDTLEAAVVPSGKFGRGDGYLIGESGRGDGYPAGGTGEGTDTPPENTGEETEATVTIEGVTWESAPEYDGNTEGTYIFTAVLPGGYTLWDGVSLPEITVTVQENNTDTSVQALLDRIAALPDIEEYLAAEPDMEEDGEAYTEWEDKLYEYVEEALAIWEEYELLTEEQQAQIPEAELARLTAWMEFAGQFLGNNRVMLAAGGGDHANHTGWTGLNRQKLLSDMWNRDNNKYELKQSGDYYLTEDITLSYDLTICSGAAVNLCLNQYTLERSRGALSPTITVESGATLNVYDCAGNGKIAGTSKGGISASGAGAMVNLYGGTIEANGGIGVGVEDGAQLLVDGATVKSKYESSPASSSGAVCIDAGSQAEVKSGNILIEITENVSYNVSIVGVKGDGRLIISGGTLEQTGGGEEDPYGFIATLQEYSSDAYMEINGGTIRAGVDLRLGTLVIKNTEIYGNVNIWGGVLQLEGGKSIGSASAADIFIGRREDTNGDMLYGMIKLTDALTNPNGYRIQLREGVRPSSEYPQTITKNFSRYMPGKEPADCFTYVSSGKSYDYYKVLLSGGEAVLVPYVMTFAANDGTGKTEKRDITGGDHMRSFPAPERTGYTLDGWYTQAKGGTEVTMETMPKEEDMTVYAHWTPITYSITYNLDGGTSPNANPETYTIESNAITLKQPTKKGYSFTGWGGTGLTGNSNTSVTIPKGSTGDRSYTANWAVNSYTVTLNGNGGSGGTPLTGYTYGTGATLPTNWKRTGYTFAGWYGNANFIGSVVTKILSTDTGNKTYWAKWIPNKYTVTFDYQGATGGTSTTTQEVTYDSAYGSLPSPTRTGYTFGGWYTATSGGTKVTSTTKVTKTVNHTLYAKWTPNKYTVTFDYQGATGGTSTTTQEVTYDSTYGNLPAPTRTGYGFVGWFTKASGGTQVKSATKVQTAGGHTLYARWTPTIWLITYHLDGGTVTGNPTTYTIESEDITLKNPTKPGYTFAGWSGTGVTGSPDKSVIIKKGSTQSRIYTANWTANTYAVTLNGNGGSGGTSLTSYTYGTGATLPADWTKTGYTFSGWYDNEELTGTAVTEISGTDIGDKEYWVKWTDDIAPVIGTLEYSYQPKNLWQWLIGRESLTITVPVTEEGSGADTITYTVTPEGGTADTKTSDISNGKATITVPADFKGTILITCTDKAGNSSANVTVGADLNATGIIIEQNAPEISALADRGPTDMAQMGDVALSESYYESVPAITVTVKDDTDNTVTAGIASIVCHIGEREYPVNVSTASLQPEVTFTVSAARIPTGVTTIRIEAADNAGNTASKTITLKVKGPEEKPAAKINYQTEKLTGLVADADYTINDTAYQSDADGCIAIDGSWLGTEITIVRKGNGSETKDSEGQKLDIPLRPAAPGAPVLDSRTDGSVTLEPITDAQYRIADGSWQTGTAFTGLEEKTVYSFNAYYPATDMAFASLRATVQRLRPCRRRPRRISWR